MLKNGTVSLSCVGQFILGDSKEDPYSRHLTNQVLAYGNYKTSQTGRPQSLASGISLSPPTHKYPNEGPESQRDQVIRAWPDQPWNWSHSSIQEVFMEHLLFQPQV